MALLRCVYKKMPRKKPYSRNFEWTLVLLTLHFLGIEFGMAVFYSIISCPAMLYLGAIGGVGEILCATLQREMCPKLGPVLCYSFDLPICSRMQIDR